MRSLLSESASAGPPLFISWIRHHGRSAGISSAIDARCVFIAVGTLTDRRTGPLRHLVQALWTLLVLLRRRPALLWVMAPPTTLLVLAWLWRAISGCRLVVDAHTAAVLDPETGTPRSMRWLRRADLVVVTTPRLAELLTEQGVRALPLHDAPLSDAPPRAAGDTVVLPASWFSDEPWVDVVDAARLLPEVPFAITGRAPHDVDTAQLPANVRLTGFLPREDFQTLVGGARLVLALTTREDTMQRAAYEAVAAGRPVVASGTLALRDHLRDAAVYTTGGGADLAAAVQRALAEQDVLTVRTLALREQHRARFSSDLSAIRRALAAT